MSLHEMGWNDAFQAALLSLEDKTLSPARVCQTERERLRLWTPDGDVEGCLSGRLRNTADELDLPVVGDFVAIRRDGAASQALVSHVLTRKSALVRKRAGTAARAQLLAANLDTVILVSSLNRDFNPRRIERALSMIWQSGAAPLLVLSKLDLCPDAGSYLACAEQAAQHVPIVALSAHSGEGIAQLEPYLAPHATLALLGSSGVGKSTLLNRLLGKAHAQTQAIRTGDERGRHTTSSRELLVLPGGALLIDTPGLRELGLWGSEDGLGTTFSEIEALARECRFVDCQHQHEPGCAVHAAIDAGTLDPARLASFCKLQRELAHEARRHDDRAKHEHKTAMRRIFRERTQQARTHRKR